MNASADGLRFARAVSILPSRLQRLTDRLSQEEKASAEELRLRSGQALGVVLPDGEVSLGEGVTVTPEDLEQICDRVTGYSRYLSSETVRQGYLTAEGGFRIGVCGTAVMRDGAVKDLRGISSLTIRISRACTDAVQSLLPALYPENTVCSTLILSPPGLGKTTLLRDLIRTLSNGCAALPPYRVAVADERGEIAVMRDGQAQMDVGGHTDVLDGCPKALAIPMLLRSAAPHVIAVDEITVQEDLSAMFAAANCGVALLATVHAASRGELLEKPLFKRLLRMNVFKKAVVIRMAEGRRVYDVESL
ncbi:MAG: stage III sporulation protein AA [Oscillospiraceae bacterium]|nr:stage III sporulation protein AA [Oscillospiraceae bacterium]